MCVSWPHDNTYFNSSGILKGVGEIGDNVTHILIHLTLHVYIFGVHSPKI